MSRFIAKVALLSIACALAVPAGAQLVEGHDYAEIRPAHPTGDPSKIVVTEFFSYQCPHCYAFSEPLNAWVSALPDDVVFQRFAVSIGYDAWAPIARAFYTLQIMGQLDSLDAAIFNAIHVQGVRLYDEAAITDWVAAHGVDGTEFVKTYNSFAASSLYKHAEQLSIEYRVPSIPTLVIDGRFMVQIADNGMFDGQLARVEQLIAKARVEKQKK
jgi:protein dithiol oxidoreductase (disulfide-forming)